MWHGVGLDTGVRSLRQTLLVLLAISTAFIAVGLTAPPEGPFSIGVRPVLWRIDAAAVAESRATALGLDIDIKLGSLHMHLGWSALPLSTAPSAPSPAPQR
jgi:hypothetical protein